MVPRRARKKVKSRANIRRPVLVRRSRTLHIYPNIFRIPEVEPDPQLICVMMPFAKKFNGVYAALEDACAAIGLKLERADKIWEESAIMDDIFSLMYRSSFVICDLTGANPNVSYETGIAHALGRPVIPIVQKENHVPFDLRHRRYLLYKNSEGGLRALKKAITKRLKSLLATRA